MVDLERARARLRGARPSWATPRATVGGDELEAVAPGVTDVKPALARNLGLVGPRNGHALGLERGGQRLERVGRLDEQRRMGLAGRAERILDADVQLTVAEREPASPANGEQQRLLDLLEPEAGRRRTPAPPAQSQAARRPEHDAAP